MDQNCIGLSAVCSSLRPGPACSLAVSADATSAAVLFAQLSRHKELRLINKCLGLPKANSEMWTVNTGLIRRKAAEQLLAGPPSSCTTGQSGLGEHPVNIERSQLAPDVDTVSGSAVPLVEKWDIS